MQPEDPIIGAVDRLSVRLADQTSAIDELHESIVREATARERKVEQLRKLTTSGVLMLVLIIIGVLGVFTLIYQNNQEAEQRAAAAAAQRDQQQQGTEKVLLAIEGCTSPGGECFRANREDTAAALQLLQKFEYVVGYCSVNHPKDPTEYKSCVLSFKVPGAPTDLPTPAK